MPYTTPQPSGGEVGGEAQPGLREIVDEVYYAAWYRPVVVKRGVDRDTALLVSQEATVLPGVSVEVERLREYPLGSLASQILGYLLPIPEGE